jgi:tripartite ATP-independent transporter DctM subunit
MTLTIAARKIIFKISGGLILLIAFFPVAEIILRSLFHRGITASTAYMTHLVLWLTFLGGISCSLGGEHLNIAAGESFLKGRAAAAVGIIRTLVSVAVTTAFAWSSLSMLFLGFEQKGMIGLIPVRAVLFIMPAGYILMAVGFLLHENRHIAALGISGFIAGSVLALPALINLIYFLPDVPGFVDSLYFGYYTAAEWLASPLLVLLVLSAGIGVPLFAVLGGSAMLLFAGAWGSFEVLPIEAYSMLTGQTIAAIPLFTIAGFILSESGAGGRLIAVFRLLFQRLPGGMAVVAVLVCAFFTTFTGASGVTILALGGLLSTILLKNGFRERFVDGLLTGSGSIGLLFPPSLPIILYGVVAQVSIRDMFLAGIIPGIVMVFMVSLLGFRASVKKPANEISVDGDGRAFSVIVQAGWELALPLVVLVPYLSGVTTIVETGAVTLVYSMVVEMLIHRDISIRRLPSVLEKSIPIVGGVLIILASSRGLAYYVVDAEIPMKLAAWMEIHVASRIVFLLLLNLALLITGCLMDIFSAIMVVVPLILPLGALFGVHPVHLGIIFLANLELGYLTPPVGLNLFLASYRFKKPLAEIYRSVIPVFLILLVSVILITYIPSLSLFLIGG